MSDDQAPETVTDAVALLRRLGYVDDVRLSGGGIAVEEGSEPTTSAVVDHQYRFEGNSDPADEAVVLGISSPHAGWRGVLVAGYGPSMAPEHVAVMQVLLKR